MKRQKTVLKFCAALVLGAAVGAFAQTPPNDDFANRTALIGSSVSFGGSLAGTTLESGENHTAYYSIPSTASGSVWWTWTASGSSTVVISISRAQASHNGLAVYTGADLHALTNINYATFAAPAGRYLRFDAIAGTAYQIQVAGSDSQPFSLQLTATNPPVFIFQPKDCAVSPYGSAFFSALASGPQSYSFVPSTTYQWFFNGVPIPRQTFPSLLVHGVTTNQAGSYSVIASNVGGMTQSTPATLSVADTDPVPRLAVLPPNNPNLLQFNLTGEPGRWYKVESSADLQNWSNPTWLQLANTTSAISIQRLTPNHFVRASLDVPSDVCVAQLKQMAWATRLFAIENQEQESATYSLVNLEAYVPLNSSGQIYPCPEDGYYAAGDCVTNNPTCSLHARGHAFPDAP